MVEGGYYGAVAELAERIGGTVARGENIMFKALLLAEEGPEAVQQGSFSRQGSTNLQNSSNRDRENSSSGHVSSNSAPRQQNESSNHVNNAQQKSLNSSPSASSLQAAGAESRGGSRNPSRRPSRDAAGPSPRNATTRPSQATPLSRGSTQEYVYFYVFIFHMIFRTF
jgi:hypothetical protein